LNGAPGSEVKIQEELQEAPPQFFRGGFFWNVMAHAESRRKNKIHENDLLHSSSEVDPDTGARGAPERMRRA
jgi:hypothetical protein